MRSVLDEHDLTVNLTDVHEQYIRVILEWSRTREQLKLEFAKDVPARMAPPILADSVIVDSLEDIAVNKVCTILSRTEPKDLCDLYFILRDSSFGLDYLLERAKEKEMQFETDDGKLLFAANLLAAKTVDVLPRMIKPLTAADLQIFFEPLAEELFLRLRPQGPG